MPKKHHLIFIHGIGAHEDDWVVNQESVGATLQAQLKKSWELYEPFKRYGTFEEIFRLYSVRYDDAIVAHLSNWAEQAAALKGFLATNEQAANDIQWYTAALERIDAGNESGDEFYTHLLDLILFWGSPSIQNELVAHVGRQLLERISAIRNSAETMTDPISIVGHSMGTSMLHKTLQAMFNHEIHGTSLPGNFKFHTVVQVANCSYALSRDRSSHYFGSGGQNEIIVRPSSWAGRGVCQFMINSNHVLDPVGSLIPFNPDTLDWLDDETRILNRYSDIKLTEFTAADIHSLTHYFRDPALHVPLFERVRGRPITERQLKPGLEDFRLLTLTGQVKELKKRLENLRSVHPYSIKDFLEAVIAFRQFANDFA